MNMGFLLCSSDSVAAEVCFCVWAVLKQVLRRNKMTVLVLLRSMRTCNSLLWIVLHQYWVRRMALTINKLSPIRMSPVSSTSNSALVLVCLNSAGAASLTRREFSAIFVY